MKRRGRRYADGGYVGYEENPEPGAQANEETERKKPSRIRKEGKESRKVSSMEFIRKYEDSPTSSRIREEAASAVKKSKQSLPGDRSTGFAEQRGVAKGAADLDQEDVDRALKSMKTVGEAAAAATLAGGARAAARGLKTAKRRYDIGKRVDAMTEAQQKSAFLRAAREAKEVDGMRSGGAVKSSASSRGDGIAKKGKTRGRMI